MDPQRFDDLARAVATDSSRRGLLRVVGAAIAGLALVSLRPQRAAAAPCKERVSNGKPPETNGCGPGSIAKIVPQGYRRVSFFEACNAHDSCYDTCNSSKTQCDSDFQLTMKKSCFAEYGSIPNHHLYDDCSNRANRYWG